MARLGLGVVAACHVIARRLEHLGRVRVNVRVMVRVMVRVRIRVSVPW